MKQSQRWMWILLFGFICFESLIAQSSDSIVVKTIYFHTSYRCATCQKLENYATEAIHQHFEKELISKHLIFESINIEEKTHEHFIDDYALVTKSIILSKLKDGNEITWKNLDKIWLLVRNEQKYKQYIIDEIRAMMETKDTDS
ncbi:nitrophenyl compound nitroreductase subunit ArsF family protein [bacterium]